MVASHDARDPGGTTSLDLVRAGMDRAAARLVAGGLPVPPRRGKLLRPLLAYGTVPAELRPRLDERFWMGAVAVQMVHEASLLHDDVLDEADERRGEPTVVARRGVAAALVLGDHYLTAAYRAAAAVGDVTWLDRFIYAVERTVAGEIAQQRAAVTRLDPGSYEEAIVGKSGELFAAAVALGGVAGGGDLAARAQWGRRVGALYQRIDDLLDYCAPPDGGKPPLQDYRQKKWTWVLDLLALEDFSWSAEEVLRALVESRDGGASVARNALRALADERVALIGDLAGELGVGDDVVAPVLESWLRAAERGVASAERRPSAATRQRVEPAIPATTAFVTREARRVGSGPTEWEAYFARHGTTFGMAARLFPRPAADAVSGVYAYCRFTDDLVDAPSDDAPPSVRAGRLAAWERLSRQAWEGEPTGVPLLDRVLGDAREARVEWRYPKALIGGVRMDLSRRRYRTWAELERYAFGVAGAVGGWVAQLFGVRSPDMLERAHALGHAMQLTNIARDVGEDLRLGRLYLPLELLERHGLREADLRRMLDGEAPISDAYRAAIAELLVVADAYYEAAWPGIAELPSFFRRPVAAAASAYRGIHRVVRSNDFDNLHRRARVSGARKLLLASRGVVRSGSGG